MRRVAAGELEMRRIKVDRLALLETLKENRSKHIAEYNAAIIEFRKVAAKKLTDLAVEVAAGRTTSLAVSMPVPVSHEDEYDTVIGMMSWDKEDTVEVTTAEFESYVMDKWDWQQSFKLVAANYSRG